MTTPVGRSHPRKRKVAFAAVATAGMLFASSCSRSGGETGDPWTPTPPTTGTPGGGDTSPWRKCDNPNFQAGRHLENGGGQAGGGMDHSNGDMDHGNDDGDVHAHDESGGHDGHGQSERLNHPPTEAQKAFARQLLEQTKRDLPRLYGTKRQAEAAGFNNIGDGQHWTSGTFRHDGCELWSERPESLVYNRLTGQLEAAMYNLEPETTYDNVNDYAGNWTVMHGHDNLCWQSNQEGTPGYTRLGGVVINGRCTSGYKNGVILMMHVWIKQTPLVERCGAFASDESLGPGACVPEFQP